MKIIFDSLMNYNSFVPYIKIKVISCSTAVDTQSFKTLASQGVQLSTHNGVVPTKSGGISDGFYLFGRSYF